MAFKKKIKPNFTNFPTLPCLNEIKYIFNLIPQLHSLYQVSAH